MADVPLVPHRDVVQRSHHVPAQQARQPTDPFTELGIALVRHRARALLAARERLERLADLGALQRSNLGGLLFERGRDNRQRCDELRVTIALQDLRGRLGRTQPDPRQRALLDFGRQVGVRADGA